MNKKYFFRITGALVCMISLGLGIGFYYATSYRAQARPDIQGLLWPNPKQLRAFSTIDQYGKVFDLDRLRGKWTFLFFGYTHCPDVCPLTLAVLNGFYKQVKDKYHDVQVAFVTVDPNRDNARQLKQYVSYFNPEFIGLRGSIEQIESLTSQLGVAFAYGKKSADGSYIVNHSASIFLTDPRGRVVAVFTAPHQVDSIRDRYKIIRDFIQQQS